MELFSDPESFTIYRSCGLNCDIDDMSVKYDQMLNINLFKEYSASFFTSGPGAFLSFGIISGLFNVYRSKMKKRKTLTKNANNLKEQ